MIDRVQFVFATKPLLDGLGSALLSKSFTAGRSVPAGWLAGAAELSDAAGWLLELAGVVDVVDGMVSYLAVSMPRAEAPLTTL